MAQTISITDAEQAARTLVSIANSGRQWGVDTAAGCLPSGWELSEAAEDSDFLPVTIINVTATFRRFAIAA